MPSTPQEPSESELTRFLVDLGRGQAGPDSALMRYVYEQLRATAQAYMRGQQATASLQPTALVHDAFVKLFGRKPIEWNDRVHFFALAAKAMRQILVNHAHARRTRGEVPYSAVAFDEPGAEAAGMDVDLLDLDDALRSLSEADERAGRVVELRYFGGLSIEEAAGVLGVSHATVERDWTTARAWLGRRLAGSRPS